MWLRTVAITILSFLPAAAADYAQLARIQTVYLLPMSNGLEQYLASHLTSQGVLHVTSDPQQADAVMTDQLGEDFEGRLDDLFGPAGAKAGETKKGAGVKDAKAAKDADEDSKNGGAPAVQRSAFGRGRGNVFLVSRESRAVVWSIYAKPKYTDAASLNKLAGHVAKELKRGLTAPRAPAPSK